MKPKTEKQLKAETRRLEKELERKIRLMKFIENLHKLMKDMDKDESI